MSAEVGKKCETKRKMSCFCCLRWPYYDTSDYSTPHQRLTSDPEVQLDTTRMGYGVVIVKNGLRICGSGAALANAPVQQNKAYFEAKLQSSGIWGVGLASRNANLQKAPLGTDTESWVLRHDGTLYHGGQEKGKINGAVQEGDILGFTYDHVEFNIFLNGKPSNAQFTGIRGTVFPVVYVDDGAIIDMQFSHFYHKPPDGYEEIMIEKSLL